MTNQGTGDRAHRVRSRRWSVWILALASLLLTSPVAYGLEVEDALDLPRQCGRDLTGILLGDERLLCTHGSDDHLRPAGDDNVRAGEPADDGFVFAGSQAPLTSLRPECIGSGEDGLRVVPVIVAVVGEPGVPESDVRRWIGHVEWTYVASAREDGGERYVRWQTEADGEGGCRAAIQHVTLTRSEVQTFQASIAALRSRGFDRQDRKYLLWVDVDVDICGIATATLDEGREQNAADRTIGFGRIDRPCWGQGDAGNPSVAAHELTHTFGAVQAGAPHATDGQHCRDEWDLMCYDDGGGSNVQLVCVDDNESTSGGADENNALLDCNGDDYFHAGRPTGWLAGHWNVASSGYLATSPGTGPGHPGGGSPNLAGSQTTSTANTRFSPASFGQHGPTLVSGIVFDACALPLQVQVADGAPTTTTSGGGLLGLGGSSTTEPSSSAERDALAVVVDWVNGAARRQVLAIDPTGLDPSEAAGSVPAGTIRVARTSLPAGDGLVTPPTRVEVEPAGAHVRSARVHLDTDLAGADLDLWLGQAMAQALGIGRSGTVDDLMAAWPRVGADRTVASRVLGFLYEQQACGEDRRVADTLGVNPSQRTVGGQRARLDLATSARDGADVALEVAGWLRGRNGNGWADVAVVCRDDVHADCLAGSGLVGDDGLVLYVPGGPDGRLPGDVRDELVASVSRTGDVYVLGGPRAVSPAILDEIARAVGRTVAVTRLAGSSRHETAVVVAGEILDRAGQDRPARVILARADDPVDAVAAGALAASMRLPILLTDPTVLPPVTATWLAGHRTVVIAVGGPRAISDAVLRLAGQRAGRAAQRVAGPDRFATSLAVAMAPALWGRDRIDGDAAYILLNGRDRQTWALALAVAPVAAALQAPVLYVAPEGVPGVVADHLAGLGIAGTPGRVTSITVGGASFLPDATTRAAHLVLAPGFDGNLD